jgi:hypothetical protein
MPQTMTILIGKITLHDDETLAFRVPFFFKQIQGAHWDSHPIFGMQS